MVANTFSAAFEATLDWIECALAERHARRRARALRLAAMQRAPRPAIFGADEVPGTSEAI